MAVDQGEKIRPVLNVSLPESNSFNENIDFFEMEKVSMSTARRFGFSLCEAGYFAKMSKFDLVDAYKIIPAPLKDLRLQGFCWLQKYFIELKQIFGAKTAVANFDIFGNTILSLAVAGTNFPKNFIHRCLDDVPFAAPANTSLCEILTNSYGSICESLNVKFVSSCPKNEKAFSNSTYGKVLGIFFDSSDLTWSLPEVKNTEALNSIKKVISKDFLTLHEMQEMLGRINHINQMCNFLRGFMLPLYIDLSKLLSGKNNCTLSHQSRCDLNIWINFLIEGAVKIPICRKYYAPPLSYKSFSSDAAGCASPAGRSDKIGCGSVGFNRAGHIIFAYQLFWPSEVISYFKDSTGHRLGNKTTTLEFLGILLPFLLIPNQLLNQVIEVKVDNVACFFGWINRHVTGDVTASILIRSLHLISAFLGSQVHITHLPRKSTWDAVLVDRLSRSSSTSSQDRRLLASFPGWVLPECLLQWLNHPVEDWSLAEKLLKSVSREIL